MPKLPFKPEPLLTLLMTKENAESLAGDLEERFQNLCQHKGRTHARLWFWLALLISVPPFVVGALKSKTAPLAPTVTKHGGRMKYSFSVHEDAWLGDGPVFAGGEVIGYRVGGMPKGQTARIANFGAPNRNDWMIMRIEGDKQTDWADHYESADDALAELQRACQ
jgi:hypothetical protein